MPDRSGLRAQGPMLLLAAAVVAAAALLLTLGSRLTFLLDDWEFLLYRPGFTAHSILTPHGEHIAIAPILIYKALLATVGMSSSLPFLAVSIALYLTTSILLFVYLRRRVDPWLALLATTIVLFLGPAFDDLLLIQMGFFGSLACGLGALLLLERGDRRGDRLACALLTVGLTFSSLGLPFVVAACVDVGLRGERVRRLYVVAVPIVLYATWWAGWGHNGDTAISLHNAGATPAFVVDAAAGVFASLFGLVGTVGASGLDWGRPLLVAALALGAWRLFRMGRVPKGLWIALALAATFWVLAGLNVKPGRGPTVSRYELIGAVFVLMVAAELLRGVRVSRGGILVAYVAGAAILASNLSILHDAYIAYRNTSDLVKADLGAVEIARDRLAVTPIVLTEDIADTLYVPVRSGLYLPAADKYGSPADSPAQLAAAPEPARVAADKVLGRALGLSFGAVQGSAGTYRHGSCTKLGGGSTAGILRLPPGGAIVSASPQAGAQVSFRRFATASFPLDGAQLAAGQASVIQIPTDRATEPWEMELSSPAAATLCGGLSSQ
ncbi:MAG: hypothetical protein QOD14_2171 [Solirubrobacterales bacterium]|nr:hypothetical protein [Solirubrobacterales bacterium]